MMVGLGYSSGDPTVDAIAQAISQEEGNAAGNISTRNNNPGNLRSGVGSASSIGMNGGFAVFPDMATGWQALYNQINLNISRGLTLSEFFGGKPGVYAGYDSPNAANYTAFVSAQTGLDPNIPLNQLSSGGVDSSCDPLLDPTCPTTDANMFGTPASWALIAGAGLVVVWGLSR